MQYESGHCQCYDIRWNRFDEGNTHINRYDKDGIRKPIRIKSLVSILYCEIHMGRVSMDSVDTMRLVRVSLVRVVLCF